MRAAWPVLAFAIGACGLTAVDYTGKECPCPDGWHCDLTTNVCAKGSGSSGGTGALGGSSGSGGASGSGGTSGVGGSSGFGGSSGLGGVAGSSATGGVGGSAGNAGSGGVDGGAGSAGAGGVDGGAGSGAGGSAGGSGAPSCLPPPESGLLLQVTLDDASSVSVPAVGSSPGTLVNLTPGDFASNAVSITEDDEYILFPQVGSSGAHVNLTQGSVDFCYKPSFPPGSTELHWLFVIGDEANLAGGTIRLRKWTNATFELLVNNGSPGDPVEAKSPYNLVADQWSRVTVTWDFDADAGLQTMHIYVNGIDLTSSWEPAPSNPMPAASSSKFIHIGGDTADVTNNAEGLIDDFRIYDHPIIP
jgi:hypothetical protein